MDTPYTFSTGTLPAGGTLATGVGQGSPPFAVQLDSTNASRAISASFDGGVTFFGLTPTGSVSGAIYVTVNAPVSQFEFAGSAGDKYSIQ